MITTFDIEFADRFIPTFCQISIQTWNDNGCIDNYTTIISPQSDIEEFMTNRHGIRNVDTAGFPTINMIWDKIYDRLEGNIVFIHNANSVLRSLKRMTEIERLNLPNFYYICIKQLAAKTWINLDDYRLPTLSKELALEGSDFNAENDARKIKDILKMILNKNNAENLKHLNDIINLSIGSVEDGVIKTPKNISVEEKNAIFNKVYKQ